jgi:hypothetical protein
MTTTQQTFAAALLDPTNNIAALPIWKHLNVNWRFAIYRNNVAASLVGALTETFPVCFELVGEEFFGLMALEFIRAHPPKSPILAYYGDAFPDYIRHFPPAASVPYLADIASLEYRRVLAYHAADDTHASSEAIASALADVDLVQSLRITLHSSVQIVSSPFAVFSLWAAHQGMHSIESVDANIAETVLIFRRGLDVQTMMIPNAAGIVIDDLKSSSLLIDASQAALLADPAFALPHVIAILIREKLITNVSHTAQS